MLDYLRSILATVREPLLVLTSELRVISANQAFYNTFAVDPEETETQLIYELGNSQWDIPELRYLLEQIIPRDNNFENFKVEHNFPSIGRRVMRLNARRLQQKEDEPELILLAFENVTEAE
jgi:PAS domain-containing protein